MGYHAKVLRFSTAGLLAACSSLLMAQQPKTPALSCPAAVTVHESVAPAAGWTTTAEDVQRPFERISIYNGMPGEHEYELAPDNETRAGAIITQTWKLSSYRDMDLFLRCRYRNTAAVLLAELPVTLTICTFRFQTGVHGEVVGKSRMSCR